VRELSKIQEEIWKMGRISVLLRTRSPPWVVAIGGMVEVDQ